MNGAPSADRLDAEFRRVRRRMRRISLLTGLAWSAAVGLLVFMSIGLIDWYWRIDAPRIRQALVLGGALLWALLLLFRVLLPAMRPPTAVEIAGRIERLRPHWRGALVSSAEFLSTNCRPDVGAPALQSTLIARAQAALDDADIEPLIRTGPMKSGVAAAAVLLVVVAAVGVSAPETLRIAFTRLVTPTSAPAWPRQHTLVLLDASFQPLDAQRVGDAHAIGERTLVYVDDANADLPDEVILHVETADGRKRRQRLERTTIAARNGRREICVAVLPAGSPTLRIRATGGDDERMPWHTLEFSSRPTVRRFRMRLTPPEYVGKPAEELVSGSGDLAALIGTRVRIDAELDRPAKTAEFRHTGLSPTAGQLSSDGRTFSVEFPIPAATNGSYSVNLLGHNGLRSGASMEYQVEGIADREPVVVLLQPAADLTVTPQAVIPVEIEAKDDLGLAYLRLSAAEPPGSAGEQLRSLPLETPLARSALIETELSIQETGLEPGRRLALRVEAADAYNLDGRHLVRTPPRTLSIVTAGEKLRELIARQSAMADSLERAVDRQSRALQQTRQLQLQWRSARQLSQSDVEALRRLALEQPRITEDLSKDESGGLPQVHRTLQEFAWNRIEEPATVERLTRLRDDIEYLKSTIAPALDHAASHAARLAATDAAEAGDSINASLTVLEDQQTAASNLLLAVAELFSTWRRSHNLNRSIAEIAVDQSQLNRETRDVGRGTLVTPLDDLTPDQRAALARLAQRQEQLAGRLEEFESQLRDALTRPDAEAGASATSAPLARQAIEILQSDAISAEMQRAAHLIARNAIADSAIAQQNIAGSLQRLEAAVQGVDSDPTETLMKTLKAAEAQAESLRQRQEQLQIDTQQSSADTNSAASNELSERQQALADETSEWAQRLRRERLDGAARFARDAIGLMASAATRLNESNPDAAAVSQQDAVERLHEIRRQLAERRKSLEFDQTRSEWSRVSELLGALTDRQSGLLEDTARLSAEQESKSRLTRSQMRSLLTLGKAQDNLADDLADLRERPQSAPAIREALAVPVDRMRVAASALAEPRLDQSVRDAQQEALNQLHALLSDLQIADSSGSPQTPAEESADEAAAASNWPLATQFKVLARLQADVSRRAGALRAAHAESPENADARSDEWQRLADRQRSLTDALQQLLNDNQATEAEE